MPHTVGTDIVSVERVRRLIDGVGGERFVARWFTDEEVEYCSGKSRPERHFAARLAAKEAVVKAIRLRWDGGIPYRSVEVHVDTAGAPMVRVSGRVRDASDCAGIQSIAISMSHSDEYAIATAVASLDHADRATGILSPGSVDPVPGPDRIPRGPLAFMASITTRGLQNPIRRRAPWAKGTR